MQAPLRVASLFTGIGGFDIAFERAGARVVLQAEIDEHCNRVLERRWPDVKRMEDVHEVGRLDVDLICGGFPCQDVSAAGKRAGLDGDRSGLWFEFARILEQSRPDWCLIENVPGLLSSNSGRDMGTVLGTLGELGYGFAYRVLDAQFFGVPQRRRRVFIVGHLGDERSPAEILLEPEGGCWNPPTRDQTWATTSGAARGGAAGNGNRGSGLSVEQGVVSALSARMGTAGHGDVANAQAGWLIPFRKMARVHFPDDVESWEEASYTNTLDAHGNVTRTAHAVVTEQLGVRRLIPLECSRLQGFPDAWLEIDGLVDTQKYRMLGNAVAVPVVEWIARRIMQAGADADVIERGGKKPKNPPPQPRAQKRVPAPPKSSGGKKDETWRHANGDVRADHMDARPGDYFGPPPAGHCAKFSDALLPMALSMLQVAGLKPNTRVLDPFAGVGKGVDYLASHGYRAVGVELEPEWQTQSPLVEQGDALHLRFRKGSFSAVFTSPTYGNRTADKDLRPSVAGTYAKSLGRLASEGSSCHLQWGPEYRMFHVAAWAEVSRVLRDDGVFLLNIKDHYRNKELQGVPGWHREAIKALGFEVEDTQFVETPSLRHGANRERVDGEWLLLFRKVAS